MSNDATVESSDATVEIRSLTKRFGDRTIFEDVSLTVNRGEVVAVIGPSGAGKSTLIRCVNGLTPFERGSLSVLGNELHGTEEGRRRGTREVLKQIRTHTGMVFQSFNLFPHLSVLENVVIAPVKVLGLPRDEARARARELLESMGLHSRIEAYPRELSGGEQQRVAICRALAMRPSLMLFDEPTSMLDPERVGEVLGAIRQLAEGGMTMMLVTHEMRFARDVADTVAVMADGALVEVGSARQVLDSPQADRTKAFLARVLEQKADLPVDEFPSLGALVGDAEPADVQEAGGIRE